MARRTMIRDRPLPPMVNFPKGREVDPRPLDVEEVKKKAYI